MNNEILLIHWILITWFLVFLILMWGAYQDSKRKMEKIREYDKLVNRVKEDEEWFLFMCFLFLLFLLFLLMLFLYFCVF